MSEPFVLTCPICESVEGFSLVESVLCHASIHPEVDAEGCVEYDGNGSEVDWNSQEPIKDVYGRLQVHCHHCGHEWFAPVTGTKEGIPG